MDLILVDQISPRVYMIFVGRLDHPASDVRLGWLDSNDVWENDDDGSKNNAEL